MNLHASCLSLPSAEVTGVCRHDGFLSCFWVLVPSKPWSPEVIGQLAVLLQWNVLRAQCSRISYLISQALSQVPVTTGRGDKINSARQAWSNRESVSPLLCQEGPLARSLAECDCGWPSCSVVIVVSCLPFSAATRICRPPCPRSE